MPEPQTKKNNQNHAVNYWEHLVENFPHQSKVWLEDLEIEEIDSTKEKINTYSAKPIPLTHDFKKSLTQFLSKNQLAISTLIHGTFGLLLNRYATIDDVIYGSAQCDANKSKNLSVVSPIIPIRSTIHEEETLLKYLKNIEQELENNHNNLSSYDSKNNIFANLFRYLLLFSSQKKSKSKNTKYIHVDPKTYPLVLIVNSESPLELAFLYNNSHYTSGSIISLIEHFVIILQKIISDPDQLVTHYSILTPEERHELLSEWNKAKHKTNSTKKCECVHDAFIQQARKTPNNTAIVHDQTKMTYKQLDDLSNQIAHLLLQRKIHFGDTIAVLMDRSPLLIATMLAIFKIGAIYVPINSKYTDENIRFIIEDSNTHLILVNDTNRVSKDFLYKTVILDEHNSAIKHLPSQLPIVKSDGAERDAYIIYTSRTTGQAKGVIIRHSSLINLTKWYKSCFGILPRDRASQFASQGFDAFFCETIPYLITGGSIHIVDDNIKLTPTLFLSWLAQEKITICDLPTAYAQVLFNMPWPDQLSLRTLKVGGEMLTHYPSQLFPFDIWNVYGPAEATIETTFYKIYQAHSLPEEQKNKHLPPPIGKAITNSEVYVVDSHMELVPIGTVGELLIGGENLAAGYYNRPQLTREKFVRNIFNDDPDAKLFRTGDLVRWLKDGNLEFVGRMDHQVKISGYRIELSEIEIALSQYPDINEVIVIEKELVNGQKKLIAYLVPNIERIRIPYQERCLIAIDNHHYLQALTEDISKAGIAVTGATEELITGQAIQVNFKLPGANEPLWLTGKVIWQHEQRAGVQFDQTTKQKNLLQKSIEFYLSTHNLMETLQSATAKRNLRSALKKRLPGYMIPTIFSTLTHLPLTFNGKIDWRLLPPPKDFERLLERNYAAPRNQTEQEIYDIWCKLLDQESISITDNFFDIGGTPELIPELAIRLFKKFKIPIHEKILFELPFIPIIAEYIDSDGKEYTYKASIQEEIDRDAVLHDDIIPNKKLSASINNPQGILLTGAESFLGIYLLRELLNKTEAKIYCLIKKGKFESVATRLINTIDRYELSNDISLANRRIVMIESDTGRDQFGIPAELYHSLASKIDLIYHCGTDTNLVTSYNHLRMSNVQSTVEIIKFALINYDKPIHFISTLASANKMDDKGQLLEEFPDANASQLIGGYTISKWVSERLLTQLKNRGLPVSIYRSGYIWGQSDTGITSIKDSLILLIKGCIQMGYAPRWYEKIRILPVDFVSEAIVSISLLNSKKSNVFHIDNPNCIMWNDLIAWLNHYGYSIKLCSHQEWSKHLLKIGQDNALFSFLPHYLSQISPPEPHEIVMDNTMNALKKADIVYPDVNDKLLRMYIKYLCEIGFLSSPTGKRIHSGI